MATAYPQLYDISCLVQYWGPDAMHTISGEAKTIFQMLGGVPYANSSGPAKVIQEYDASNNKRWPDWKPSRAQVSPWTCFPRCNAYMAAPAYKL